MSLDFLKIQQKCVLNVMMGVARFSQLESYKIYPTNALTDKSRPAAHQVLLTDRIVYAYHTKRAAHD